MSETCPICRQPIDVRAQLDQMRAMLHDFAPSVVEFWASLIGEGMDVPSATRITSDMVMQMLRGGK